MNGQSLVQLRPSVLVLNFVDDPATTGRAPALATQVATGLDVGSAYHGYSDPAARQFLAYQILKVVDLTDDGVPPPGWSHLNSSKYPLKCQSGDWYQFDYSALFDTTFAAYYGFPDPANPSQYLTLTALVDRGMVNEVWIVVDGNPDPYICPDGVTMNDFQLPEVIENKQKYDATDNPIAGSFDPCAGNGCATPDDQPALDVVGRSLRFLYINSTRGPGCGLHSLGHGIESTARPGGPIPYLNANFTHFANFDLDARFGAPFSSWYGACGGVTMCVNFLGDNSLTWVDAAGASGAMNPYNAGCGSVHYPPNARTDYDDQNPYGVLSTCEHYGLHDGPGGTDAQELYTNAKSKMYDSLEPDCEGGWQVYWRQSFPGLGNVAVAVDGTPMKNWWPYLFY